MRPTAIRDYDDVIGMYIKVPNPKNPGEWIWKFVGKVFKLKGYLDALADQIIHYREESREDVCAWKHEDAYSIDVAAWKCAKHYHAKWMAVYLKDRREFWYVDAATVDVSECSLLDPTGRERVQIRVPWSEMIPYANIPRAKVPPPLHRPEAPRADCIVLNEWELSTPAAVPIYVPRKLRSSPVAGSEYLTP